MADIFISYARSDREKIEKLAAALEAEGYSVWWDRHIAGGAEFSKDIERELAAAKAVIVCWSANGVQSRWVKDEANEAAEMGKLVAVTLDDTLPPIGFKQFHAVDYSQATSEAQSEIFRSIAAKVASDNVPPPQAKEPPAAKRSGVADPRVWGGAIALLIIVLGLAFTLRAPAPAGETIGDVTTTDDEAPRENSVGVLPFAALSAGDEDKFFGAGLAEEIINALTAVPELQVTARTSSFYFKDKDAATSDIASALDVAHLVEGSVRRSGDAVRIIARLVRAEDGAQLWSETYDRSVNDDFAVQIEIAESVARALGVVLDEGQRQAMSGTGIGDVEAFIAYQRGYDLLNRAHLANNDQELMAQAGDYFTVTIDRAPEFADAYVRRADRYTHLLDKEGALMGATHDSASGIAYSDAYEKMMADYDAAVAVERDPAKRLAYDMARQLLSNDWSGLNAKMRQFFALDPTCMELDWMMQVSPAFGYAQEAYDYLGEFVDRCSHFDHFVAFQQADAAFRIGRAGEALAIIEAAEKRFADPYYSPLSKTKYLQALGRDDAAAEYAAASGSDTLRLFVHAHAGQREVAQEIYHSSHTESLPGVAHFGDLFMAAIIGDRQEANRVARAMDASPIGPLLLARNTWLCSCGAPFDIEETPKFQARLEESGLVWPPPSYIDWPLKDW